MVPVSGTTIVVPERIPVRRIGRNALESALKSPEKLSPEITVPSSLCATIAVRAMFVVLVTWLRHAE